MKRFYDWITANIGYDYEMFSGRVEGETLPSEILKSGKTTCGGFSSIFSLFAESAGIETIIISGFSKAYIKNTGEPATHAWNAVRLGGTWYIVDTTHAHRINYSYREFSVPGTYRSSQLFLSSNAKLAINLPREEQDQLVDNPIDISTFLGSPRLLWPSLKYQLQIDFSKVMERFHKGEVPIEDSNHSRLQEVYAADGDVLQFSVDAPARVQIRAVGFYGVTVMSSRHNDVNHFDEITFKLPPTTEVFAKVVDQYDNRYDDSVLISYPARGVKRYLFGRPTAGDFYARIYAKTDSDEYIVVVKGVAGYDLDSRVKDEENNTVRGFYSTERSEDLYTFRFRSPAEGQHTARIYQIDSGGIWNIICYFRLPNKIIGD